MTEGKKIIGKLIFGIVMVLIYLGMAFMLAFTDLFNFSITYRVIFALLFFLYGLFRAYRLWKS